jgi:sugar transferase EpsL
MKRLLDIGFAALGLLASAPVLLLAALLIRLTMGGPVFFRQERPGLEEKPFTLYKLRTMREVVHPDGTPLADGMRLTSLGRVLRLTSLDELPQLYNILRGEMSFVGPRPLLARYLPYYTERERLRHRVRPGLTGLAQIAGRNGVHWAERLELDACYVEQQSLRLDARIVARTFLTVLKRSGVIADPGTLLLDLDVERALRMERING